MGCGASAPAAGTEAETEDGFQWEEEDTAGSITELPSEPKPPPPAALRRKRQSVSAECYRPNQGTFTPKVVPKTPEQLETIRTLLSDNILFKVLDEEQLKTVIDAVESMSFNKEQEIIKQGDQVAEWFFILADGECTAYVNGTAVKEYATGGFFGELALLYNAPRAATVSTKTDCSVWALDRNTFRAIVLDSNAKRRRDYETFLSQIELLKTLDDSERSAIADVMEPKYFDAGAKIIEEGGAGDAFYILEDGEVKGISSKKPDLITTYKRGDFFGELALLTDKPRQATCTAVTRCKVATLDRDSFNRLLGKLQKLLERDASDKYAAVLQDL
mmetsp:Transcript_23122/g.75384  ORF Transcript_23122/g.75384 Transcript_23122/m.75384 type:complete len:331 (+) Transcript_23122:142-1134(+)|eukprot:CAMPEP_0170143262 /NCGR_PEP_ID=MMETSP0033_2-20121228/9821_1 /TAXON_ID=195969 /ORGANISM="Dolichomastix tenuilepis, Strain CCMP3274" /LENGTH=330 /DNA_ID=CAMNT_0010379695 /DNA_START=142 /DNA_END=1134 /DNA_ORIENTATION=+